jgi:Uma2 family endonuclease
MEQAMRVSEAEYIRLALEHPDEQWELHCGVLRKKPPMTWDHTNTIANLAELLHDQLDGNEYLVFTYMGRIRRSATGYYIPDVYVVPREMHRRLYRPGPGEMHSYPEPLPFVAEVWSQSTGRYDVRVKLREYQARGDAEIWLVHPYRRTIHAWRRRPEGNYTETVVTTGSVQLMALPGTVITIDALFEAP